MRKNADVFVPGSISGKKEISLDVYHMVYVSVFISFSLVLLYATLLTKHRAQLCNNLVPLMIERKIQSARIAIAVLHRFDSV